jgi:hypothetical protein
MDDQHLLEELLRAAERPGVTVRVEPFETPAIGGEGSCVFRGDRIILIDAQAPLRERIAALTGALAELETDTVFMVPEAREAIEAMRASRPRGRRLTA